MYPMPDNAPLSGAALALADSDFLWLQRVPTSFLPRPSTRRRWYARFGWDSARQESHRDRRSEAPQPDSMPRPLVPSNAPSTPPPEDCSIDEPTSSRQVLPLYRCSNVSSRFWLLRRTPCQPCVSSRHFTLFCLSNLSEMVVRSARSA